MAKRSKSSKRVSKKITSLARAVNRGEIKASIKNKVKKGSMLKWGEFQQAFSGCGHTKKALGRMYNAYKKAHGAAPKKRKSSKSSVAKRRKSAAKRAKGSKKLVAIDEKYILKLLKARRKKQKGVKVTLSAAEKAVFKKAIPHIKRIARQLIRQGDSKYAAVNKAITRSRSRMETGKRRVYKGKDLRRKGVKRLFNPRRRRRNSAKAALTSIRPLDMIENINAGLAQWVGKFGRDKKSQQFLANSAQTGLLLSELVGAHYLFSKIPQIDEFSQNAADWWSDTVKSMLPQNMVVDYVAGAPSWVVQNGYYTLQGAVGTAFIAALQSVGAVSEDSVQQWGMYLVGSGLALDVAAKLFGSSSDLQGVHLNGYGDGGQYMVTAPQTIQMQRRLNPGYGALKMNPGYGALSGAEGSMGAQGAQGAQSYGAVLFSGSGY